MKWCEIEGSLKPNTMDFARDSNWSNRADIVFVQQVSWLYMLLFTDSETRQKRKGNEHFLNTTTKTNTSKTGQQSIRPCVDKCRRGFPPKALSELGLVIVPAGRLELLEACLSCEKLIGHKHYQITALFSIVMKRGLFKYYIWSSWLGFPCVTSGSQGRRSDLAADWLSNPDWILGQRVDGTHRLTSKIYWAANVASSIIIEVKKEIFILAE